jgi:hypothetical protein
MDNRGKIGPSLECNESLDVEPPGYYAETIQNLFPVFREEIHVNADISTDDIRLPSTHDAIQASIEEAFQEWENVYPAERMRLLLPKERRTATMKQARCAFITGEGQSLEEKSMQHIFANLTTERKCHQERTPPEFFRSVRCQHFNCNNIEHLVLRGAPFSAQAHGVQSRGTLLYARQAEHCRYK